MIEVLRDGRWATRDRLLPAAWMAIATYLIILVYLYGVSGQVTTADNIIRSDFLSFWVAACEALSGVPEIPYLIDRFSSIQEAYLGEGQFFAFFYPPTFLFLILPLGAMSAMLAFVVFQVVSLSMAGFACSRITGNWNGFLVAAALPATFNSLFHGQSALLCAALLGGGLAAIAQQRMILAGVFIGLLTIKPQMGVLIPFALLAGGYYRTFLSAAATTVLFALISWIAFGTDTWSAFLDQTTFAREVMSKGQVEFYKMVSVFSAARLVGLPIAAAYLVQGLVGLGVLIVVCRVWHGKAPVEAKAIVLVAGGYLVTPFVLSYDLAALAVALSFAIRLTGGRQTAPWMWTLAAVALLVSICARYFGDVTSIPIGWIAPAIFFWVGLVLSRQEDTRPHPAALPAA
ncbi:glycosyltransferase family 87 protein [Roseibium sp. SCPC15]|uniref:glycosyltransferase family 87 protein n=1 Tax=Roseibium sp. SCP15 TaxID=3141376 RepID=UPI0033389B43